MRFDSYCGYRILYWSGEFIYVGIAERLVAGLGFTNGAFQPSAFSLPGYPFVLYLIIQIHESVLLANCQLVVLHSNI